MTQTNAHPHRQATRNRLMMSCASVALAAAAVAPTSARAQAFQGNITGTTGSVTRVVPQTGGPTETITIGSSTATINWNPTTNQAAGGGQIDFLPSGHTATFTSTQGLTDYTVLNRVLPSDGSAVTLNGNVVSTLQGTNTTGGKVWFYSPGGIVVGASAVFNVGGLLLTTNDVTSFGTTANGFNATFSGPASSTSKIQIMDGAQINALQQNSYVALVAPRIEQGGKVRVNGSAAYVAGEQLTMTMNQGLFDIQVDVGTDDTNGVVHTGETSGPANASAADHHKIYMVAVPKNTALTMLLGGKVGFDDAVSADIKNGQIVLSSGRGIADTGQPAFRVGAPEVEADLSIGAGTYTSDVVGVGRGTVEVDGSAGDVSFGGDLSLESWSTDLPVSVSLLASDGHQLSVAGNLGMFTEDYDAGTQLASASIIADSGGSVTIGGTTTMNVAEVGLTDGAAGYANSIYVEALNGGTITSGTMTLDAWGLGADGVDSGGDGHGGWIDIEAQDGGAIHVNGDLTTNTNGTGGNGTGSGGIGYGGQTNLSVYGGTLTVAGDLTMTSNGTGGTGSIAGNGFGGSSTAYISSSSGETGLIPASVTIGNNLSVEASGTGGNGTDNVEGTGGQGGSGYGGDASFNVDYFSADPGSVTFSAANAEVLSNATGGKGGNGIDGGAGGGGYAYGYYGDCGECGYYGSADFTLYGGSATLGNLLVESTARGGNGGAGSNGTGGLGGEAIGGYSSVYTAGDLTTDTTSSYARAFAGNGGSGATQGDGGYADGGGASIDVAQGGRLRGNVDMSTVAIGGAGNTGGEGYGGTAYLDVQGTLFSATALLDSSGTGGAGVVQGGDAWSDEAGIDVDGGAANIANEITIRADATAGNASAGTGGSAYAGYGSVDAEYGGQLTGGDLAITANAQSGNGLATGNAEAGEIELTAYDWDSELPTSITLGDVALTANGTLGTGTPDLADSGSGSIYVEGSGASINVNSLTAEANGTGFGGIIEFLSTAGYTQPGSVTFGSVTAHTNGGDWGGGILAETDSGSTMDLGEAHLTANGPSSSGIWLFAGSCTDCGGDGEVLQPSALPPGGGISATNLTMDTTGSIYVALSGGADVAVDGTLKGTAGNFISLVDDGTGGAIRAHEVDLSAITIDDNADIVADIIRFSTAGGMSLGDLSAGDSITLNAGGDIQVGDLQATNTVTLTSLGSVSADALDSKAVSVNASDDLSIGHVDASQSANFTAGGLAEFTGTISAPTITVTSGDINIDADGSLGVWGVTNLVTLNAVSNGQPIVIGANGPAVGPGQYELNEDGDIHTASLVINAQGGGEGGAPDVQVYDVEIGGSNTAGGGNAGKVTLNTGGNIFVNGGVDFADAGANDSLTMNAGHAIEVNTDRGGIQIADPSGKLTGTLALNADNVWIASGAVLSQLEDNVNFSGRDAALAANSGTANQDGFVRAGTITSNISQSFLVQNSGTAELFGGIDTGPGGLAIDNGGNGPATVIAYGRKTNADGTVLTNQQFIGTVQFGGTLGFTDDSSINGCTIGGQSCGGDVVTELPNVSFDMSTILGPLDQDKQKDKDKDDEDESDDGSSVDPSMRLINTTPVNLDRRIDEPVTSGGDVVVGGTTN